MKTSQKVLFFVTIVVFITFVAGMLAAGKCERGYDDNDPLMIEKFGNSVSAISAILSFIILMTWTIILMRKIILPMEPNFVYYLYMVVLFPFFLTIFVLMPIGIALDYHLLSQCYATVYEAIWWNLMGWIGAPVLWIALALAEIVMVGLIIFRKKTEKIPDLN